MGEKTCLIFYNLLEDEPDVSEKLIDSAAEERTEIPAVRKALRELGFNVRTLGVKNINSRIVKDIEEMKPDFVFNLCEGLCGESSAEIYVAGLFELLGIPYTGSAPLSLGLALNKRRAKEVLDFNGVAVPKAVLWEKDEPLDLKRLEPPYIVKPVHEDGSTGIFEKSVTEDAENAEKLAQKIYKDYKQPALIEEYIDGREFTIFVLEKEKPMVLAISEIDFSKFSKDKPRIISYRAKWDRKSRVYRDSPIVCPANVETELKIKLEKISIAAFSALGCRDYGRVDIRVNKNNKPYVIEVNTNPDIAPESGFEIAAKAADLTYKEFIGTVASNALNRGKSS
jgi:D-alanine-D-alanine ligase